MLITIQPDSPEPLYLQIYSSVIEAIAEGTISPGSALPSTRELARDLGINYHTVNKAYNLLEIEGFVRVRKKKVEVVEASDENIEEFIKKWRYMIMGLIREARAMGIKEERLSEQFSELLSSGAEAD
ncbi:hypothetical protein IX51_01450 [uncultured archaeon]|nr:hypothetical protein IX51_01450 [uncultured archaeon]HKJ96768.1 GntR family transcriptional regulator [Thermoplasmataceae archaeon]